MVPMHAQTREGLSMKHFSSKSPVTTCGSKNWLWLFNPKQ
jgi:hypothetical protein